jgi:uncharacterized protein YlxP (DUF503 family)
VRKTAWFKSHYSGLTTFIEPFVAYNEKNFSLYNEFTQIKYSFVSEDVVIVPAGQKFASVNSYCAEKKERHFNMVVGTGQIKLRLFDVHSLKAKRSIVKSMISRLQNRFNISVAETALNDSHDWAEIGFALVGNDASTINAKIDKVFNMADELGLAMIADTHMEIIHL